MSWGASVTWSSRLALLATATGVLLAISPAVGSSTETSPTVDAVNFGLYSHYWSPERVAVDSGGAVTIRNTTAVAHGVEWVGGPATPECSAGVPVGSTPAASGKNWSGTCTFTHAGTYTFYCTVHGPAMSATVTVTTPGAPTVSTGAASAVFETQATLAGSVNPQGKATTYHFDYGKTASYGEATGEEPAGEGAVDEPVSISISALSPGTTYHYRLVAKNAAGVTEGVDRTFTTVTAPSAPSASSGPATALGEAQATLNGVVNPDGEATSYLFEWGSTSLYGHSTEELPAGEDRSSHAESATLTGLAAGITYHFRIVASNASGTVPGLDQTFTTTAPPAALSTGATTMPPPTATPLGLPATTLVQRAPAEPVLQGVSLRALQHGASVKGVLDLSASGAGARLEVDLFASVGSAARTKRSPVLVGRLVRASMPAGRLSFAVSLSAQARSALRRQHRLALSIRIALTPRGGQSQSVTRRVVLSR